MEITFTCPHCGEVTLIDESFIGQSGPCRRCDAIVTVPKIFVGSPLRRAANLGPASPPTPYLSWLGWSALLIPILGILLLPMLASIGSHGPTVRIDPQIGFKRIMLALSAYEAQWGRLPRAYWRDEAGEKVLPWRAAILPHLGKERLFERYAKNEPWNSPTNYALTATVISEYANPHDAEGRTSQTGYLAVTGPGSLFVERRNLRLADSALPLSETIVLVEIPESDIYWSEPTDVDLFVQFFRANESNQERRFFWRDGAEVAFADGSIRHLSAKELEKKLQAMFKSARPEDVAARFAMLEE